MSTLSEQRKATIRKAAIALGFSECRFTEATAAPHRQAFREWLSNGCHGEMAWMEKTPERREDPRNVVDGAKSVIVLALNYWQGELHERKTDGAKGIIARYALGDDYHQIIEERLRDLCLVLEEFGSSQKAYVDYGPVLERDFASESGIGWNGKSTVQIHPKLGTWFFLGTIITSLELPPDLPGSAHCGKCSRCIDACPTQAITHPHRVDARRCISYLTIEHPGTIPEEFRTAIGARIFGCDDCLSVCPWNRFAQTARDASRFSRDALRRMSLRDFLALSEEEFLTLFKRSPIKRIKRKRFLRNVCVALGNVGNNDDLPALQKAKENEDPLVSEHATWAIASIKARKRRH